MDADRITRHTRILLQIPVVVAQAVMRHGGHLPAIARKLVLSLKHRYEPREAFAKELLDPTLPDSEFSKHLSRSNMSRIQRQCNPAAWEALLADKSVFYRYCTVCGIPIPTVYATFSKYSPGVTQSGKLLAGRQQWVSYLLEECPPEIVLKPNHGFYGFGIMFLERTHGEFVDNYGKHFRAEAVYDRMMSDKKSDMFVIQERIRNHRDIARLSGSQALQTMRMTTVLQADGSVTLAWAHLKLAGGEHLVDNYRYGELNNLMAGVDTRTGVVRQMLLSHNSKITAHPKTGIPIVGFQIPYWSESRALVERSARKFSPLGTIGWDVAVTQNGPMIIEGNIWYDPPSAPDIADFLAAFRTLIPTPKKN
ncbi:MAG: hypothetical protein H6Q30_2489 [Bacteroidetes bacterium]|jgi:hypothetical protein|nr:hypothetical protein [Bacteroidota bacterium]